MPLQYNGAPQQAVNTLRITAALCTHTHRRACQHQCYVVWPLGTCPHRPGFFQAILGSGQHRCCVVCPQQSSSNKCGGLWWCHACRPLNAVLVFVLIGSSISRSCIGVAWRVSRRAVRNSSTVLKKTATTQWCLLEHPDVDWTPIIPALKGWGKPTGGGN